MEASMVDPQPVLAVGTRLTTAAMFSSPGPRRKFSEAGLSVSPFVSFDTTRIGKRRRELRGEVQGAAPSTAARTASFGLINGGVMIPTMVGFASIIYKDPFFVDEAHNYLPLAIKLVFLSSAVHQLCFVLLSTLPFAVGQVQDAGLIFLSSMAVTIVSNMREFHESDPDRVMSTTVVSLSLCTAFLGVLLMITGKLKLARLVQYLPLPVVGGYLAFIGLFCGLSGLHLTTGETVEGVAGLEHVMNARALKLLAPAAVATGALFLVSKKAAKSQFALPLCMIAMPVLFYLTLLVSGNSLQDARDAGWVAQKTPVPVFYKVFSYFDPASVEWSAAFPAIIPTFFAMFAVVAFGSSLDVAAVQFELGKPMDYDQELVTVGFSNTLSGLTGGYTGSYIFSQTIFTLRNGIRSRLCGFVVAVVELALFFLPIDLLSILPRFFFGSVLLFVSIDLILEWLVHSYLNLALNEYALVWLTFVLINLFGLEVGMTLGVVCSALQFVYSYSSSAQLEVISTTSSRAVRSYFDRKILAKYRNRVVALRLNGYHFFGTVISTIVDIQSHVVIVKEPESTPSPATRAARANDAGMRLAYERAQQLAREIGDDSPHARSVADLSPGSAASSSRPSTLRAAAITRASRSMSMGSGDLVAGRESAGAAGGSSSPGSTGLGAGSSTSGSPRRGRKRLGHLYEAPTARVSSRRPEGGSWLPAWLRGAGAARRIEDLSSHSVASADSQAGSGAVARSTGDGSELTETHFVVLDMSNVSAVDATAARACFLTVLQSLNNHNVRLVLAGTTAPIKKVLCANGVLAPSESAESLDASAPDAYVRLEEQGATPRRAVDGGIEGDGDHEHDFALSFETLDEALQFCEEAVLGAVVHADAAHPVRHGFFHSKALVAVRDKYFEERLAQKGEVVFSRGKPAGSLYVVESGRVDRIDTMRQFSGGSIFGIDDFFQDGEYSYTAKAASSSRLFCLTSERLERLQEDEPQLALALHRALIKHMVRLGQ